LTQGGTKKAQTSLPSGARSLMTVCSIKQRRVPEVQGMQGVC